MRLGAVFADILADLEFAEFLDDVGPDEHGDEQGGERCEDGAKGEITEDPEWVEEREQLFVEQPVEQVVSNAGSGRDQVDFTRGSCRECVDGSELNLGSEWVGAGLAGLARLAELGWVAGNNRGDPALR